MLSILILYNYKREVLHLHFVLMQNVITEFSIVYYHILLFDTVLFFIFNTILFFIFDTALFTSYSCKKILQEASKQHWFPQKRVINFIFLQKATKQMSDDIGFPQKRVMIWK